MTSRFHPQAPSVLCARMGSTNGSTASGSTCVIAPASRRQWWKATWLQSTERASPSRRAARAGVRRSSFTLHGVTLSRAGSRSQSEPSTESLGEALTALFAEVGIPFEEMLHTVESALATPYVRAFNPAGFVTVKLDTKTCALDVRSRLVRPDGTEVISIPPS